MGCASQAWRERFYIEEYSSRYHMEQTRLACRSQFRKVLSEMDKRLEICLLVICGAGWTRGLRIQTECGTVERVPAWTKLARQARGEALRVRDNALLCTIRFVVDRFWTF